MSITLSPDATKRLHASIKRYFAEHLSAPRSTTRPAQLTFRATAVGFVTAEAKIEVKDGAPPIEWNPVLTAGR